MTLTNEHDGNVALALAVADEDIPAEVSTDKGGCQRWETQGVLLVTYAKRGNPTVGCLAAGVSLRTHRRWLAEDTYGYRDRFRLAHAVYVDSLEGMVGDRLGDPKGNRGSDVLLIARLNAEDPDKWRGNSIKLELPDELRDFMQRRQAEDQEARKALPVATVIEHQAADEPPPWETE